MLLNIQSVNPSAKSSCRWKIPYISNKLHELQSEGHVVPYIALTETWLKTYIHDSKLHIDNYNLYRSDRSTRIGGGVMLYCHENLPITNVETFDDTITQALICTCETSKMITAVVYRPPEANETSLKSCL